MYTRCQDCNVRIWDSRLPYCSDCEHKYKPSQDVFWSAMSASRIVNAVKKKPKKRANEREGGE